MSSIKFNISQTKTKHIDARTLDEIAQEIGRLKDSLKYNHMCLLNKKKEMDEIKKSDKWNKTKIKPRKTFAFRINCDIINNDIQKFAYEILTKALSTDDFKQWTIINNFIYIKTKTNKNLTMDNLQLPNGMIMEQIDPDCIIKRATLYNLEKEINI